MSSWLTLEHGPWRAEWTPDWSLVGFYHAEVPDAQLGSVNVEDSDAEAVGSALVRWVATEGADILRRLPLICEHETEDTALERFMRKYDIRVTMVAGTDAIKNNAPYGLEVAGRVVLNNPVKGENVPLPVSDASCILCAIVNTLDSVEPYDNAIDWLNSGDSYAKALVKRRGLTIFDELKADAAVLRDALGDVAFTELLMLEC